MGWLGRLVYNYETLRRLRIFTPKPPIIAATGTILSFEPVIRDASAKAGHFMHATWHSTWDLRQWRGALRLGSALVLLSFVICHLIAHCVLLISLDDANAVLNALMYPWRTRLGTAILVGAITIHLGNALWSIYIRRSLRLNRWEWTQLGLGLCIPVLLMVHVVSTRVADLVLNVTSYYSTILIAQWVLFPWLSVLQMIAVLTVWTHASIGIHYWLRTKRWYAPWRPLFLAFALLLPALALAGFVTAGNEIVRAAKTPDYVSLALEDSNLTAQTFAEIDHMERVGWSIYAALVLLPFAGRGIRAWHFRRRKPPMLTHASGRSVPILPGSTVLETLRERGIPHASVCGGRARCTTCRVLVTTGLERLSEPSGLEAKALSRIGATAGMRLACQIRPTADIAVMPLLTADASAADGTVRGGLEGSERPITVVFVDLRGSTTLGEARLPYDVLFVLNQFFYEMTRALTSTNGHYSQFTGDGLMALYGLYAAEPAAGAADAVRGARQMLVYLEELNRRLKADLREPLRIGIGIHFGEAIVGAMGPPRSQIITAIGDTVNTCARLESLTKDYGCLVIISRPAAEAAGLRLAGRELHEAPVKGRNEPVQFYALQTLDDVCPIAT
jgi:adenylate cyclase